MSAFRITGRRLALVVGLALAPAAAHAEDGQFTFIGYVTRAGSLSAEGAGQRAVYLWWDPLQGELPPDVTSVELYRGAEPDPIATFSASDRWTGDRAALVGQLRAFYGRPENARRRLETLEGVQAFDALRSLPAGQPLPSAPPPSSVTSLNFEDRLADLLIDPPAGRDAGAALWTRLASRLDVGVALARGRAYVDAVPATPVTYRLVAVAGGARASLGEVAIDPNADARVAAPTNGRVLTSEIARCDAPEAGRIHGAVALTWDEAGSNNATERFVNSLNTAGFEVWRAAGACDGALQLRARAATRPANDLTIAGLTRVTDRPVLAGATGPNEPPIYLEEAAPILEAAGFGPGAQICYYVAARDLSGNYGETHAIQVVVPDAFPPPAPWGVEAVAISASARQGPNSDTFVDDDRMRLRFTHVDVAGYVTDFADGRTFCNVAEAQTTGRLRYAATPEGCAGPEHDTVNLSVTRYLVYRFDSEEEAAAFTDADGDGEADEVERAVSAEAVCAPADARIGARGRRVATLEASAAVPGGEGRRVVDFVDPTPAQAKGDVYWYRVAALGTNDRVSALGPPVRGLFPDETKPPRLEPEDYGFGICGPVVTQTDPSELEPGWPLATDHTRRAAELRLWCPGVPMLSLDGSARTDRLPPAELASIREGRLLARIPFLEGVVEGEFEGFGFTRTAQITDPNECDAFRQRAFEQCECEPGAVCAFVAEFIGAEGDLIASAELWTRACSADALLYNDCSPAERGGGLQPVLPGQVVSDPLVVRRPPNRSECVSVDVSTSGRSYRLDHLCGADTETVIDLPPVGGGLLCFKARLHSKSNVVGTDTELGCVKGRTNDPPPPPGLSGLSFREDANPALLLSWTGANQPINGVFLEWWREGDADRASQFAAAEGLFGPDNLHAVALPVGPAPGPGETEQWCVRGRALAAATPGDGGGRFSEFTSPVCATRTHPGEVVPASLPWPAIPRPPVLGEPLAARYTEDGRIALDLGTVDQPLRRRPEDLGPVNYDRHQSCLTVVEPWEDDAHGAPRIEGWSSLCLTFCYALEQAMGGGGDFVAYRRSRDPAAPAQTSAWVQVSSLNARPFCALEVIPAESRNTPFNRRLDGAGYWVELVDPHFDLAPFTDLGGQPFSDATGPYYGLELLWIDRYPHQLGREYQYQLVYFDDDGEVRGYRETTWALAPEVQ